MNKLPESKKNIAIIITISIGIILFIALVGNIISTRKSLDKIIYEAKIEGEKTLISSGRAVYTEDIEKVNNPISNENLPQNNEANPQEIGTQVAPKENWNIETVKAISVGNGNTVPVPIGFYYVGGDLNTGVIISDEETDKYDGQTDKTTWEYTTNLKGNQFVWIPCTEEQYVKSEVWNGITQKPSGTTSTSGTLCNSGWDKTTYTSELPQIRKYGGFYVARYEAGLAKTITEFTSTQKHDGSNQVYNKEGIPQSKAGIVPWIFIDWTTSQKNAENMYNINSVSSGLITGTQWDVMLKRIIEKTDLTEADLTNSINWGNHINNSIEYKGRMAKINYTNAWNLVAFGGSAGGRTSIYSSNNGDLLTTGASKQVEKYHIYDIAGNLWEWTDEASIYKERSANNTNTQYRVVRGGGFVNSSITYPACFRSGSYTSSYTNLGIGFRVVLYIK